MKEGFLKNATVWAWLFLSLSISLMSKVFFGYAPDAVLVLLVVLAAFISAGKLLWLAAISAWVLAFKPEPSAEIAVIFFLPFLAYALHRLSPWRALISGVLFPLLSAIAFYALTSPTSFVASPGTLLTIVFWDMAIGLIFFSLSRLLFEPRRPR